MKNIFFILCFTLTNLFVTAQITFTNTFEKELPKEVYDSLTNHPSDNVIVGQRLLVIPQGIQVYNFVKTKTQHQFDKENSIKIDSIKYKTFLVVGVTKNSYMDKLYVLQEEGTVDTIFFITDKYCFPFICLGYYDKLKKMRVGHKFVFNKEVSEKLSTNIVNGLEVSKKAGLVWDCIELTVVQKTNELIFILENHLGEKVKVNHDFFGWENIGGFWSEEVAQNLKIKYGTTNWEKILNGVVSIGMTKDMVIESWGKPSDINKTSYNEQWVYKNKYLYFTNNKLTAFN